MWASIRLYFYAALALGILVGGVTLCHHIENIGVQKEAAKVTKVGVAAEKKVAAADATAQSTETQSAIIFKQAVSIPPVGDIGISCVRVNARAGGSEVPAANTGAGAAASDPATLSAEGPPYDPSGAILTRGAQADAQIAYLQRRVKELEAQMNGAP